MNFIKNLLRAAFSCITLRSLSVGMIKFTACNLLFISSLILIGCNSDGNNFYKIVYPSGNYVGIEYSFHTIHPVEGSDYYLDVEGSKNTFDLHLLDENEQTIAIYEKMPGVCRGEMEEEEVVWLCAERWNSSYSRGYVDSKLLFTKILKINPLTGEKLIEKKTGENEFYITSREDKAYFYSRGKEAEEKLFGLIKTKSQNAEIFYRDVNDWDTKQNIYTFSYIGKPELGEGEAGVSNTLNFYLNSDSFKVALETYAFVEEEWKDIEKWSVEIPLEQNKK